MGYTESAKKATYKYREKFERLNFTVLKGKRQEIVDHATAHGESLNAFVNRAVAETMDRDNKKSDTQ